MEVIGAVPGFSWGRIDWTSKTKSQVPKPSLDLTDDSFAGLLVIYQPRREERPQKSDKTRCLPGPTTEGCFIARDRSKADQLHLLTIFVLWGARSWFSISNSN